MINSAPSAGNYQSYRVYVVKGEGRKKALSEACFNQSFLGQDFVAKAPVVLVFCADARRASLKYGKRGADLYCIQDATIAATFAHLAAVDLGLSSVWVGAFDEETVLSALGISGIRPVVMLPVGYSSTQPTETPRRPLSEVFIET